MTYVGNQNDTISPYATLTIAFSDSLASPLDFDFSPPVAQEYSISFSHGNDTAFVSFVSMLPGNTQYTMTVKSQLTGKSGGTLAAGSAPIVFTPGRAETEPNNAPALADTLIGSRLFGRLSETTDTDVFVLPPPIAAKSPTIVFASINKQDSFAIVDNNLHDIAITVQSGSADTILLPTDTLYPLYMFVFAPIKGASGYYSILYKNK
jgi:hypothetical protein